MVDIFALALTHGLMLVAVLQLLKRDDLDRETLGEEEDPRA